MNKADNCIFSVWNYKYNRFLPCEIVRKIDEQYAGDGKKVDDALAEIALNEAVTPYWRRYACRRIHDLKRRKETAERLEAMEKTP